MGFCNLGGDRLQSRLVAVGQREIAAARRKLERQRPADTTGRAGHGGGGSTDRSHWCQLQSGRICAATLIRLTGFGNRRGSRFRGISLP